MNSRRLSFAAILVLVALASFAIVLDRLVQPQTSQVDFHESPTTYATTSLPPHPASPARTPDHG